MINNLEQEPQAVEGKESAREKEIAKDESFELAVKGAEILETPSDGGFFIGLQAFVAWVKNLLASDD